MKLKKMYECDWPECTARTATPTKNGWVQRLDSIPNVAFLCPEHDAAMLAYGKTASRPGVEKFFPPLNPHKEAE
jgi:hypothetical protein